ncbi:Ca-activated chloride channel family protein [Streptoalloteichus tenebrarius]|uniref:Ca-activated chloride channel family protein n=1 Tax=Streptoalloteichus tenebrarius (strain ATCC 17920 / DSM 40477 / JCM 4838 / CBS 697.72 / NBRC 16177 / NCIMB 11028 / NRRL B-12390 / A12253. 1 / ISP 5477) TaxID=1933 RepID=A0ABT1HPF0_STRSD|nr:Ca-activated chloride channel family protein [Streptoalloteichus tenebrarius]
MPTFTTPHWFGLLAVVALLAVGYLLAQRHRRRRTLRFTNLALLDRVAPRRQQATRHVPAVLSLCALTLFAIGLAGPTAQARVPRDRATVMLILDESLSMGATDVQPSRLDAVKAAATEFAHGLPPSVNLGLVTFAGTATVQVMPTTLREPVLRGIQRMKLRESTATGEALAAAHDAAQQINQLLTGADGPPPTRIVLLSDGRKNVGREVDGPAQDCKNAHIDVDTISFGTTNPEVTVDIQGRPVPVPSDPDTMRRIAAVSGGHWYAAPTAEALRQIYGAIGSQVGYETRQVDASKPWMILGTVFFVAGAATALRFNQRIP